MFYCVSGRTILEKKTILSRSTIKENNRHGRSAWLCCNILWLIKLEKTVNRDNSKTVITTK